jgi:acetylornithine deacetylase/succinyl-diaminopimelate desuccinylase-like protein
VKIEQYLRPLVETREPYQLAYTHHVLQSLGHTILAADDLGVAALIPGERSDTALMLQGHTDRVDPGQGWRTDPYKLVQSSDGGRLYGLGVADMEGAVATYLAIAEQYSTVRPPIDLVLEFVEREEIDGAGTVHLAPLNQALAEQYQRRGCILGEPTDGNHFGVSRNGTSKYLIQVNGAGGHSGRYHEAGTTALERLLGFQQKLKAQEALWRIQYDDAGFVPPVANITNAQFGDITGSQNKIGNLATAVLDIRMTPSMIADNEVVLEALQGDGVRIRCVDDDPPTAPSCPEDSLIRRFLADTYPDMQQTGLFYASDMQGLQDAGWPTVHHGPGDMAAMHEPNESIARDALYAYKHRLVHMIGSFGLYEPAA